MLLIILAIIVVPLLFYYYLWKPQVYWRNKNVKQGRPLPLLGDSFYTTFQLESITDFVIKIYKNNKETRYFGIYQATLPTLVINDPELIKIIQVKDFDYFMDHQNFGMDDMEPVWNKNLIALRGQKWRDMRATLSPTFTSSKMRVMFELMEKTAKQYVDFYLQKNENIIKLELKDSFTRVANDVIANCAFGITVDSLQNPTNDFYMHGKAATSFSGFWKGLKFMVMMFFPTISKIFKFTIFPPDTMAFFKTLVRDSVKLREEKHIVRPDVIHIMMEARKGKLEFDEVEKDSAAGFAAVEESEIGKTAHNRQVAMTEEDMAAQVLIFFFAGFDTVSTVLSFTCYELALNPDIQQKMRDEIDATNKATNFKLTYEILNKMKYLDMVVSEGLRKHPPAGITDRLCTKPYTIQPQREEESPVEVKVGQILWFPIIGIHRNEEYYPNPEKFDPERFAEENKDNIKPYTFMPFGTGPRNCIGSRFALMEVKTLLYHILSQFELTVIDKTVIPLKYDKGNFSPAIAGGCWVGFKRRQNA